MLIPLFSVNSLFVESLGIVSSMFKCMSCEGNSFAGCLNSATIDTCGEPSPGNSVSHSTMQSNSYNLLPETHVPYSL